MATWRTTLGSLLVLAGCTDGYLESSTTINSICSADLRFAIVVELNNPERLAIDEVTATLASEEQCFLESSARDAPAHAVYSCLEQGAGTYVVQVTSGEHTWSESVEVSADECHVTKLQELRIDLTR